MPARLARGVSLRPSGCIRLAWAAPLLLSAACTSPFEPRDLGTPIASPAIWRDYWEDVWTRCGSTQRSRPAWQFSQMEFRVVAGTTVPWDGQQAVGAWEGNRIYIAETMLEVPLVVRHEMLHAQLGRGGHPPVFASCDSLAPVTTPANFAEHRSNDGMSNR